MTDTATLRATLEHFAQNIENWRLQVALLRAAVKERQAAPTELLVSVEDISGEIYHEIDSFKAVVADVAERSGEAAGELAEIGETLHLLLLEITELGTTLYSTRSEVIDRDDTAGSVLAELGDH